ncbi:MAG: hypothetical protein WAU86_23245 [Oricola sp.]
MHHEPYQHATDYRGLVATAVIAAAAWGLSSVGYYEIMDRLGLRIGYNDAPVVFAFYYAAWTGLVAALFYRGLRAWYRRFNPPRYKAAPLVPVALVAGFALVVLPRLPVTEWTLPETPPDLLSATPFYFLPKTVEILFQQVLITALILSLRARSASLIRISLVTAALFGGFHLSMVLTIDEAGHVAVYTIAAMLFGAIAPWLYMRARDGFAWAYGLHLGFYALDTVIVHLVMAAPAA